MEGAQTLAADFSQRRPGPAPPASVGDRIAQLILERIVTPEVIAVDDLDATDRVHTHTHTFLQYVTT